VLTRTYTYLDTEYTGEDAADYAEAVSDEILTEYVPATLEQAYRHNRYDLVEKMVGSIETIALDGLAKGFSEIVEDTADGFGTGFEAAPLAWEGNRLRGPVTESMVELSKATATKSDYGSFISVFGEINSQIKVLLRRRPDSNVTLELVEKYFRQDSIAIFELLLERYGPKLQDKEINWISPTNENGAWTLPDDAEPIRYFWRGYADLTQEILRYRISEDTYPFAPSSMVDGWRKAAKCAAEAELDDLATLCCVSMIQFVYQADQIGDGSVGLWANTLAHLRVDHDSEIVDQAFVLLQAGKQPVGASISVLIQSSMSDDTDDGFFARFFHSEEKIQFEEWLVDFRSQVQERTEMIQERN